MLTNSTLRANRVVGLRPSVDTPRSRLTNAIVTDRVRLVSAPRVSREDRRFRAQSSGWPAFTSVAGQELLGRMGREGVPVK
jgi:hypothetical protein